MTARDEIVSHYRSYLDACNRRAWEELKTYLAETIVVNRLPRSQDQYLSDVRATTKTFPDYRWRLRSARSSSPKRSAGTCGHLVDDPDGVIFLDIAT